MSNLEQEIEQAALMLRSSRRVLAITGAGISADSGLPTYRGIGGLYDSAETEDGLPIEVALSGSTLQSSPELTWKYLMQVESACRGARHNAAHSALADMAGNFEAFTVLTQNIDGFHRDAGQRDLIEMHGNVHELYCVVCARQWTVQDYSHINPPPRCEVCDGSVRPRVVLFGEMLPEREFSRLQKILLLGPDMVLSIGTTSGFPYISAPVEQASATGKHSIEINPGDTGVSHCASLRIRRRAIEVLPLLAEAIRR